MHLDILVTFCLRRKVHRRCVYFFSAGFAWAVRLEDLIKFLKRPSFRFNEEQVDEDEFEDVPKDEEYIEPVSNLLDGQLRLGVINARYVRYSKRLAPQKC